MGKVITFISVLLLSTQLIAADFIKGQGKFYSKKEDSASFVKKQLLNEAFKEVIGKSLTKMGFDTDRFWESYNQGLNTQIESAKKALLEKHKEENKEFRDSFRKKRLSIKARYGSFQSYISSYVIKRMSRASSDPNLRFMRVEAQVRNKSLSKLYYRFVGSGKVSGFQRIFLSIEYKNRFFDYSSIGITNEKDFTDVIDSHWLSWFEKNKPANIAEVQLISLAKANEIEKSEADDNSYAGGILVKAHVNLKKLESSNELGFITFSSGISGYILDIKSNKVLDSFTIAQDEKKYENVAEDKLSSAVANHLYRLPMTKFTKLMNSVTNYKQLSGKFKLNLMNYSSMKDIEKYRERMENIGVKYFLSSSILSISKGKCVLEVQMDGNYDQFKSLNLALNTGGKKFSFVESQEGISVEFK